MVAVAIEVAAVAMGKRKPLSLAEKQVKMLELFHETASFFTYKEVERLADKQKGITPQSAKDVLDELVSQQHVCCEKLASQTLYFALPSQAITRRKRMRAQLDSDTARCAAAVVELRDRLQKRQAVRCCTRSSSGARGPARSHA